MKTKIFLFYFVFLSLIPVAVFSQKDSLNIDDSYWEDQLYINITYNILNNQPDELETSKVSYGVGFGYIKDIPLNKRNNIALGLGLGYNYDFYTNGLVVEADTFSVVDNIPTNKFRTHNLEFPIQLRWRTSDVTTFSFWRVYLGARVSYNLANKFWYTLNDQDYEYKNIDSYNKLQTGLELSFGYGAFNFFTYYGFSPIFKDALLNNESINSKVLKFGLIFYLL